ncbi:MAG: hypothetical protein ABSE82_10190 [Nitrososphaerales archaeon]
MSAPNKFFPFLLSLYMATVGIAAMYYNWEYARRNGFARWAILGEIATTARALVWPYFAFHPGKTELKTTPLTEQQFAEMEVKKAILALNYSQQAAYLLNSNPHEHLEDYPNLQDILAYRRKAIEVGQSADTNTLNSVFPGLGDRFKGEFIEAMSLFVHGYETQSDEELRRSKNLNDEWADWYTANRKAIEDATNAAISH